MDPVTLAGAAIGLLVPFLKQIGEKVLDRGAEGAAGIVGDLYERIKAKFQGDRYAGQLLEGVEADPTSRSRQTNLTNQLADLLEADPDFRKEIEDLLNDAKAAGLGVTAIDAGITAGGDVYQSAGRDAVGRDKIVGRDPGR